MSSRVTSKREPLDVRVKFNLTRAEADRLDAKAVELAEVKAKVVRRAVLGLLGDPLPPRRQPFKGRTVDTEKLANLVFLLRNLTNNVNQLSKQANAGMVPLTRAEIVYMLNQHQLVISAMQAAFEGMRR